jgi:hypothetical protein
MLTTLFKDFGVLSVANVKVHRLDTWHEEEDELVDQTEPDDPDVDEVTPEFILKVGRFALPKVKQISHNRNRREEKNGLDENCVFQDQMCDADNVWQRSGDESKQIGREHEAEVLEPGPAHRGDQSIEKNSLDIGSEPFVPDYSVKSDQDDDRGNDGDGDDGGFQSDVFKCGRKVIGPGFKFRTGTVMQAKSVRRH